MAGFWYFREIGILISCFLYFSIILSNPMSEYYAYRIWLLDPQARQSNWTDERGTKEEEFYKVLEAVKNEAKIEFRDKKSNMAIIFGQQRTAEIFTWVFARKHNFTKEVLIEASIEKVEDMDWPNANLLLHKSKQIIYIEKSQRFLPDIDKTKAKLERFFANQLANTGIKASLVEINDNTEFWKEVVQLDFIEEVILDVKPPNLFKGLGDWDTAMGRYRGATNFESLKIWFKNKTTGLLFKKEEFEEPIKRLSQGQGDYKIIGKENGEKKVITSVNNQYSQILEDELNSITTEKIEKAFDDAEKLNDEGSQKEV